jgi:hypothetical protein
MSDKMLEVRAKKGSPFNVDISDEAVGKFGDFKHGDAIIDQDGDEGVIQGVAPFPEPCSKAVYCEDYCEEENCPAKTGEATLWYSLVEYGDTVFPSVPETKLVRREAL